MPRIDPVTASLFCGNKDRALSTHKDVKSVGRASCSHENQPFEDATQQLVAKVLESRGGTQPLMAAHKNCERELGARLVPADDESGCQLAAQHALWRPVHAHVVQVSTPHIYTAILVDSQ